MGDSFLEECGLGLEEVLDLYEESYHPLRPGVYWVQMSFEPLQGWREVVTERRRKREFAHSMRRLAEEHCP